MKKILLFLVICISANAQNNADSFDWSFNGGGGFNTTKRMQYNSQGDLLFLMDVGHQTTFEGTTITEPGSGSFPGTATFIGKRAQNGASTLLIKKNTPNPTYATFQDFVIDNNDNIIVTGATFGYVATVFYDFGNGIKLYGKGNFIAKYNPQGVCQWANLINYNLTSNSYSENKNIGLGVLPNNDIYFANRSTGYNASYQNPFWLIRFNAAGAEIWHKEWLMPNSSSVAILTSKNNCFFDNTGKAYFYIYSIQGDIVTIDGTVLTPPAGGHPSTSSLLTINSDGTNGVFSTYRGAFGDIAVEKTTGNVLLDWRQYFQNPSPFDTLPLAPNNTYQFVGIVAVDSNRNFINRTAALFNTSYGSLFPLGNLNFVTNTVMSPTETVSTQTQTFTATKYTPTWKFFENFTFTKFVAHPEINGTSTNSYDLMAQYNNKLAVSGSYSLVNNATILVNGTTLTTCNNDPNFATLYPTWATLQGDVFISQLTISGGLDVSQNKLSNFKIYPNPSNGVFNIEIDENLINAKATIYNLLGQKIKDFSIKSTTTTAMLNKGMYLLKIEKDGSKTTKKLIVN